MTNEIKMVVPLSTVFVFTFTFHLYALALHLRSSRTWKFILAFH